MSRPTQRLDLLKNVAATGSWMQWPGGRGTFAVEGTFDGATVTLQFQGPNATAIAAGPYTTLTANGAGNFDLPPVLVRAAVSGGSSPAALYATAVRFDI